MRNLRACAMGPGSGRETERIDVARRRDRPAGPLDQRAQAILRTIIEEYVTTAQPVGSQVLVERYQLGVSAATVRNIMADLERAGFLSHPHTSAGRVPTDAGYRLLVESIAGSVSLAPVEQLKIRHQFGQVEYATEQWFRLAAAILASVTREAGLATPAKAAATHLRHLDLVPAGERTAGLVLVLSESTVKHCLLALEQPFTAEQMERVASRLSGLASGGTAETIETALEHLTGANPEDRLVRSAAERALAVMREFDSSAVEDVFSEGLLNVMAAPEFSQSEKLRRVFVLLQDRDYLGRLVHRVTVSGDVQVFIGSENEALEMQDVSLVLAPYVRPGRAVGVVGVLGPTRMAYPHAISSVRYVSGLINEMVDHLYS
jgi:heat-inducible transcriptional repressor